MVGGGGRAMFKARPTTQFKKHGANKKEKWDTLSREFDGFPEDASPMDTIYRILCPSKKIGGVIGKGGSVVKALRGETQAKITVADSVPGSDERIITIYSNRDSSSRQDPMGENNVEDMQPHCASQDALLKVHDKIIEEDLADAADTDASVTARLLVSNNLVGCVLGKGGDVIQRLRRETGASIRVLPPDLLPACAMSSDELVQISGKPAIAKRALFQVSTLLHQNTRRDRPPSFQMPFREPVIHHREPPMSDMLPPGDPMWSHHNFSARMPPPPPWMREYRDPPDQLMGSEFGDGPVRHGDPLGEFSVKIVCSNSKIGGVIGKAGVCKRMVEEETGVKLHIERASTESEDRVIQISAFETLQNPRSQVVDAILLLQSKTSELSEKGTITTRLLVPSSKVGCILGQAGSVINEMRRRTRAEIRVYSKEERPKCASVDEELVQVSGSLTVAKDALAEIASRLRLRCLRESNPGAQSAVDRPVSGFSPARSFLRARLPGRPGPAGVGSSADYESFKGDLYNYEHPNYPVPPSAPGYRNTNSPSEFNFPSHAHRTSIGTGGGRMNSAAETAGARWNQQAEAGPAEVPMKFRSSSDHMNAGESRYHSFKSDGQNNQQHGSYSNAYSHQGQYHPVSPQQGHYQPLPPQQGHYEPMPAQQGNYQPASPHQGHYQPMSGQQGSYQPVSPHAEQYEPMSAQQGNFQPISPHQGHYQCMPGQQRNYQPVSPAQGQYQPRSLGQGQYQPISSQRAPYRSGNQQSLSDPSKNEPQNVHTTASNQHSAYQDRTPYNPYHY